MSVATDNIRQISNGLRILKISRPEEVEFLGRKDLVFDALETGPAIENFTPFVKFAPRIKALWYCDTQSAVGLEQLDKIESITAHSAWRNFDFRLLKNLKYLRCHDASATQAKFLNHPGLEVLDCGEGKIESMELLRDATALRHFRPNACKVKSLEGIQTMQSLVELRLSQAKVLNNIDSLAACTNLQVLEMEPCKKLTDVSVIRALHALRVLYVSAPTARFTDLDWLAQSSMLRCAFIDVPLDGIDWEIVASHPSLYSLSVQVPTGGLRLAQGEIAKILESKGRIVKEISIYTKVIEIELEPVATTLAPLSLEQYRQAFGNLPPI